jgi:hypothetical protein
LTWAGTARRCLPVAFSAVAGLTGCSSQTHKNITALPDFCRYQQPVATCVVADHGRFTVDIQTPLVAATRKIGGTLSRDVTHSLDRIGRLLPGPQTDILMVDGTQVIPHTGVAGVTSLTTGQVMITLDTKQRPSALRQSLRVWVTQALSHEVNHSVRIHKGPGFGTTLLDEMISEGVASAFDIQVQPTIHLPWTDALTNRRERMMWGRARPLLNHTGLYDQWFFGGGGVPYDTAFQIGHDIVRDYLNRHPKTTAASLVNTPARAIFSGSRYSP